MKIDQRMSGFFMVRAQVLLKEFKVTLDNLFLFFLPSIYGFSVNIK